MHAFNNTSRGNAPGQRIAERDVDFVLCRLSSYSGPDEDAPYISTVYEQSNVKCDFIFILTFWTFIMELFQSQIYLNVIWK